MARASELTMTVRVSLVASWKTGNAVKVTNTTNLKGMVPWEYTKRVSDGTVAGEGRTVGVAMEQHEQNVIDHQMFPF